jgi:hypothetical protein
VAAVARAPFGAGSGRVRAKSVGESGRNACFFQNNLYLCKTIPKKQEKPIYGHENEAYNSMKNV